MKIINPAGDIMIPGVVPTGNLVWVDAVNGNDSLAVRGRLGIPFKTLAAAKNVAVTGDTIVVMPGTHSTSENLAKNNVHWHLMQGAKIQASSVASIFKLDSAITMRVSGDGELAGSPDHAIEATHASAYLFLRCRYILATDSCVRMTAGASAYVEADSLASDESSCVDLSGGTLHIRARSLFGDQTHAVNMSGGTLNLEAYSVYSNVGKGVYFSGGTAVITAFEIYSTTAEGVEYNATYAPPMTIRNARLVSKATPSSGNYKAGLLINGNTTNLRLANCAIVAANNGAASPYSVYSAGATTLVLYGVSVGSHGIHANVSHDSSLYKSGANYL